MLSPATLRARSTMLSAPELRIWASFGAATEKGTSCRAEARFWAVTTTCSGGSVPVGAGGTC
jgi:hypothetical protein